MWRWICMGLVVLMCQYAQAQEFPNRTVRLVVANPPGGTTDLIARLLAKKLAETWRQSVIVDNRGGASGTIGTDHVAKATPDGYTLLVSAPSPLTTNTILLDSLPYDPVKDFAPITLVGVTPSLLMVPLNVPAKSVAEFVALAKARPGKIKCAISGQGNPSHLHCAMFATAAGIEMVNVPYKGGGPALIDLLGGQVEIMFNPVPAMLSYVQGNKLRALAVTSEQRLATIPDVPTMKESGFPQIGSTSWYGVLAPAKVSPALLKKLHADFIGAVAAPEVREALVNAGTELVAGSPEQFSEFIRRETEEARKLLKASGAKRE